MFQAFLEIAEQLNKLGITPLLMGSVGLERRTGKDWQAGDLDIHVPSDPRGWEAPDDERIYQADALISMMNQLGYVLVDRHEHEFHKDGLSVEFGGLHSLPEFAGVELEDLEELETAGVRYYLPTLEQFLKIYQASSKDSYRAENNNQKDFAKIAYLKEVLKWSSNARGRAKRANSDSFRRSESKITFYVILQGNFETLGSKFSHETEGLLASPLPKETIKIRKIRRKKCLNLKILS